MAKPGAFAILDGGLGHELKRRGVKVPDGVVHEGGVEGTFIPGVLANRFDPNAVVDLHLEFIESGANVITTNSFIATPFWLRKVGLERELEQLIGSALSCASKARAASARGRDISIAGSLPPLTESYHNAALTMPQDVMVEDYTKIVNSLKAGVDVFLCETLASIAEAEACLEAIRRAGTAKPVWISFTVEDVGSAEHSHLRGGEKLEDAVQAVCKHDNVKAVLVNCCSPSAALAALRTLDRCAAPGKSSVSADSGSSSNASGCRLASLDAYACLIANHRCLGVRMGAYANGFKVTTSEWMSGRTGVVVGNAALVQRQNREEDYDSDGLIRKEAYARHVREWLSSVPSASIVGGCCGISAGHIAQLAHDLAHRVAKAAES